jgi:ABC-type phosphate transport system substrate-binding protein
VVDEVAGKGKSMKQIIISSIAGIALLAGCASHNNAYRYQDAANTSSVVVGEAASSESVFSNIPQPVKDTLKKEAPDGEVVAIVKQTKGGATVYEIAFANPDRYPKIRIAADGTLVSKG